MQRSRQDITVPAFWDLHIHGVAGIDFMHAGPKELAKACEILGRQGIAAFAPTLLTASTGALLDACSRVGEFIVNFDRLKLSRTAARPIGIHLEGPFLSPEMAGAHPKMSLTKPSLQTWKKLQLTSKNQIAILTIAPEVKGAMDVIKAASKAGVHVQVGHTTASLATLKQACACGATGTTHLFNAMRMHHRDAGVLPLLHEKRLTAELITDGIHVSPEMVAYTLAGAASSQIYGITDGCSGTTLGPLKLRKKGRIAVVASTGTLAGGTSRLVDHPAILMKHLKFCPHPAGKKAFLAMYSTIPVSLFRKTARKIAKRRCRFDAKSLRFLGTS